MTPTEVNAKVARRQFWADLKAKLERNEVRAVGLDLLDLSFMKIQTVHADHDDPGLRTTLLAMLLLHAKQQINMLTDELVAFGFDASGLPLLPPPPVRG